MHSGSSCCCCLHNFPHFPHFAAYYPSDPYFAIAKVGLFQQTSLFQQRDPHFATSEDFATAEVSLTRGRACGPAPPLTPLTLSRLSRRKLLKVHCFMTVSCSS